MIDVLELEKRYQRYQLKKHKLKIIVVSVLFILLFSITIISIFMPRNSQIKEINTATPKELLPSSKQENIKKQKSLATPAKEISDLNKSRSINTLTQDKNHTQEVKQKEPLSSQRLEASMNFLEKIDLSKNVEVKEEIQEKTKEKSKELMPQEEKTEIMSKEEIQQELKKEQNSSFQLTKKDDQDDLKSVVKRFKKNKNPKLSLFLAKRYYNMQKYYYAYNYALITNELDNTLEDGWILFAKSLVKLDQKQKAIDTLKKYIYHSNSDQAKILLDSIENGSFK